MQIPSTMTIHVRAASSSLAHALGSTARDSMLSHLEAAAGALDLAMSSHGLHPLDGDGARRILAMAQHNVAVAQGSDTGPRSVESIHSALFATDLLLP